MLSRNREARWTADAATHRGGYCASERRTRGVGGVGRCGAQRPTRREAGGGRRKARGGRRECTCRAMVVRRLSLIKFHATCAKSRVPLMLFTYASSGLRDRARAVGRVGA